MSSSHTIGEIVKKILSKAGNRKKLVFVSGNFNILHPGHIRFLQFSRACGDFLIVGVQSDEIAGNAVYVGEKHRLESVKSLSDVDFSFLLEVSPAEFITQLRPAIVIKGKEHEKKENPERDVVASYGGQLLFSSGELVFSSMELLRNEFSVAQSLYIFPCNDYLIRHNITAEELRHIIHQFSSQKVSPSTNFMQISPIFKEKILGRLPVH